MTREPADAETDEIEEHYRASRFLDAFARLERFSSPEEWSSTRARVLAGRLLGNLGAHGRARRLVLKTWRRDASNADARYFMLLDYHERHGPVEALRLMDEIGREYPAVVQAIDNPVQADVDAWLLRARCLSECRDFEAAQPWLELAVRARPDLPWTHMERSISLERADRYAEAVEAARHALSLRPGYTRAIWQLANLLMITDRDAEALELLTTEAPRSQSGHIPLQLGRLLSEQQDLNGALGAFELAQGRFVAADSAFLDFFRARRADLLHRLGRDAEAIANSAGLRGRYWENFAARIGATIPGERRQLAVPFVRQHHMTCAPATIAAVTTYLGHPVDHAMLAQTITYDGTPDHEERHWLESNGWIVREFRVTWDATLALIRRELPFTLVTTWVGSAHLQAVIGCDERLGTLIIRDPYAREAYETLAAELLEQQAPFGPRGMVFVRRGEEQRLADLPLEEACEYDEWYQLRRALVRHDREAAAEAATRLASLAPSGRLTLWAERNLAYYDDNPARALTAVSALRDRFPTETNLQLEELALLAQLGRRVEHRQRIEAIMRAGKADPRIWREQIELWRADARHAWRAQRLARRYLRARPGEWLARLAVADVLWDAREFDVAVRLYRLAAVGGDKTEGAWRAYFASARHTGRETEALQLLQTRKQRLGAVSAQPAITLARALDQLDREMESRTVLTDALKPRANDGDLLLELATLLGRIGEASEAAERLAQAKPKVSPAAWHRAAAQLAGWRGDHADALAHHTAVLGENPLDITSLRQSAHLRAIINGPEAALAWLAECTRRNPHFLPLRQLRLQWLRDRPAEEALAEVRQFLELEPNHAWALREQALILLRAGSRDEALQSARRAEEIEPGVPASPGIVGQILLEQREFDAAREATRRGLRLEIAATWLMPQLLNACPEFVERVAAAEFLRDELRRQIAPETGYLKFREVAAGVLSAEALSTALDELRASHPDRWEPWSANIQQAIALGRVEIARDLAQQAVERFPLVPRAWVDLAEAHRLAADAAAEQSALERARQIAPGWRDAAARLASVLQRNVRIEDAARVLQSTLAHNPLDAVTRLRLADLLWRMGRQDEAIAAAETAAEHEPDWDQPLLRLAEWSRVRHEPERVRDMAKRIVAARPGDPAAHRRFSRVLSDHEDYGAALEEATMAVRLAPTDTDAHDLRAYLLAMMGRRDEAIAACTPPELLGRPAFNLQGRQAWVRWQFGERKAAIDAMVTVTTEHPDYAWGWQQLAEWRHAIGENGRAAEAAQKNAELAPNSAMAWAWVAALKIADAKKAEAIPVLERVLRLDPTYGYASLQLLKLSCETLKWAQADHALALIRQHASRWHTLRCEVLYHRWRRDEAPAFAAMKELCLAPNDETSEVKDAADDLFNVGWSRPLERALREVLPLANANPETGAIWMRARLRGETFGRPIVRRMLRCGASDATQHAAWRVYLEWLGEKKRTLHLRWHLWRRGKWLAEEDRTWGTVGFVLTNLSWYRTLARWQSDWRTRRSVEPWMLQNLCHALLAANNTTELAAVVTAALQRPSDHTRPTFVAWAARLAAFGGDYEHAQRLLGTFENPRNNTFAKLAAAEASAIVEVARAPEGERRTAFREQRELLREAVKPHPRAPRYVHRDHRRALYLTAHLARSPWRWWYRIPLPTLRAPVTTLSATAIVVIAIVALLAIAAGAPAAIGLLLVVALQAAARKKRR